MYLYQIIVLNILWIFGFNALFHDNHILAFVKNYAATRQNIVLQTVLRPFALCVNCMSSVHGSSVYFALGYLHFHSFPLYFIPFYCIVLLGTISLISNFLDYLSRN